MKCCKRREPLRRKARRSPQDFKSVMAPARSRLKGFLSREICSKRGTHWTWPSKETVSSRFSSQPVISLIRGPERSKKIAKAGWLLPTDLPWTQKLLYHRIQHPLPPAWTEPYRRPYPVRSKRTPQANLKRHGLQ